MDAAIAICTVTYSTVSGQAGWRGWHSLMGAQGPPPAPCECELLWIRCRKDVSAPAHSAAWPGGATIERVEGCGDGGEGVEGRGVEG
jgi:hypothetical protein